MSGLKLPMACGEVTLLELGKLDPAAPGSHDEDYVYPIGFRTCRKHASAANPGSKCLYHSEIVAGPQGAPQFKVTCADMSEHSFEDSTPNGAWSLVFEAIASCTRRSSRGGGPHVSERKGWDMFGLNSDKVRKALMGMAGIEKCTKLRYNKEKATREAKEKQKQQEEEEREEREEREREKKRRDKMPKKKKHSEYQQPPTLEPLKPGEWRCMEEEMQIVPCGSEEQVAVRDDMAEGPDRQREQLHKIWELTAVQQFLRSFRAVLGVSPLTTEDFHTAFLECSSALKVIHLRLLMPAGERKKAPEMAEGDGWLDSLREKLQEETEVYNEETEQFEKLPPAWSKFLEKDPMPESIHQYFELTLRQRALILWWLCENLLDGEEDIREHNIGNLDWDASADALRFDPNAFDKEGNAYWYFEGSSGVMYKEGPPKPGRKSKAPEWEPVSRGHEDLAEVGAKLQQEGKKRKLHDLHEFATWIVEKEAPRLQSKEQARERAKSKAALMEMLPRKRSSRVATKEEREREEEEKRVQREAELAQKKAEEEKKRKERERLQQEKARQEELAARAKEEEREKAFREAERERRLRKRRRLLAKQARQAAHSEALQEAEESNWWEIGNHVEVFSEEDWWQAVILKNKGGQHGEEIMIYVAYIGGTEEDNEWLPITSVRVRKPTDSFWEEAGGESDDDMMAEEAAAAINDRKARSGGNGAVRVSEQTTRSGGRTLNGDPKDANIGIDVRDVKPSDRLPRGDLGLLMADMSTTEDKTTAVRARLPEAGFQQDLHDMQHVAQLPQLSRQMHSAQLPFQNQHAPLHMHQMQSAQMMPNMGLQMPGQNLAQQHQFQQQLMHRQLPHHNALETPQGHYGGMGVVKAMESRQQIDAGMRQQASLGPMAAASLQLPAVSMGPGVSNGLPSGNALGLHAGSNALPGVVQGLVSFVSHAPPNYDDVKEEQQLRNGM